MRERGGQKRRAIMNGTNKVLFTFKNVRKDIVTIYQHVSNKRMNTLTMIIEQNTLKQYNFRQEQ